MHLNWTAHQADLHWCLDEDCALYFWGGCRRFVVHRWKPHGTGWDGWCQTEAPVRSLAVTALHDRINYQLDTPSVALDWPSPSCWATCWVSDAAGKPPDLRLVFVTTKHLKVVRSIGWDSHTPLRKAWVEAKLNNNTWGCLHVNEARSKLSLLT